MIIVEDIERQKNFALFVPGRAEWCSLVKGFSEDTQLLHISRATIGRSCAAYCILIQKQASPSNKVRLVLFAGTAAIPKGAQYFTELVIKP
jgi:hypothetical protein